MLFFEGRKKQDLYLWAAKTPGGPSAKFLVQVRGPWCELLDLLGPQALRKCICGRCPHNQTPSRERYSSHSHAPSFPLTQNVHTMDELKLTGNHLKGSRPVLSFDGAFDQEPHLQLMKEMFTQVGALLRMPFWLC